MPLVSPEIILTKTSRAFQLNRHLELSQDFHICLLDSRGEAKVNSNIENRKLLDGGGCCHFHDRTKYNYEVFLKILYEVSIRQGKKSDFQFENFEDFEIFARF